MSENGEVVIGDEPINAAAFAIHSEIYKARPDVHAACHAHSVYRKAWSVFGKEWWKLSEVDGHFGLSILIPLIVYGR